MKGLTTLSPNKSPELRFVGEVQSRWRERKGRYGRSLRLVGDSSYCPYATFSPTQRYALVFVVPP